MHNCALPFLWELAVGFGCTENHGVVSVPLSEFAGVCV